MSKKNSLESANLSCVPAVDRLLGIDKHISRRLTINASGRRLRFFPWPRAAKRRGGPKYPWKKKPKHSRRAHNHFRRPALELLPPKFRKRLLCRSAGLRAERHLRLYFVSKGYEVEGGKDFFKAK
jgi:hypothetical protein